ncbi:hypothetical protein Hanom_Chr10g00959651 [Helianthus anomalus]
MASVILRNTTASSSLISDPVAPTTVTDNHPVAPTVFGGLMLGATLFEASTKVALPDNASVATSVEYRQQVVVD